MHFILSREYLLLFLSVLIPRLHVAECLPLLNDGVSQNLTETGDGDIFTEFEDLDLEIEDDFGGLSPEDFEGARFETRDAIDASTVIHDLTNTSADISLDIAEATHSKTTPGPKDEQTAATSDPRIGTQHDRRWPSGVVNYVLGNRFSRIQKISLAQAFRFFNDWTCIRFKYCKDCPHRVVIVMRSSACSSSHAGMNPNGTQIVNLGPRCWTFGVIVHQMLHVLGFPHEHQRADRDRYVDVVFTNLKPKYTKTFDIVHDTPLIGSFCYGSILMYPPNHPQMVINQEPCMVAHHGEVCNVRMRSKKRPTGMDVYRVNTLYQCGGMDSCKQQQNKTIVGKFAAISLCYHPSECCKVCIDSGDACKGYSWSPDQGGTCFYYSFIYAVVDQEGSLVGLPNWKYQCEDNTCFPRHSLQINQSEPVFDGQRECNENSPCRAALGIHYTSLEVFLENNL